MPTFTGSVNTVAGVYLSLCHSTECTVLEGQKFPRCGYCNKPTTWIYKRPVHSANAKSFIPPNHQP